MEFSVHRRLFFRRLDSPPSRLVSRCRLSLPDVETRERSLPGMNWSEDKVVGWKYELLGR